jgi:hypothetical protein
LGVVVGFAALASGVFVFSVCWRRQSVCLSLRWHPRDDLPVDASPFGVFVLALASAFCLRASSVAPVRGGTYFSLPPQRKVGKRKRLTPPILVFA